MENWQAFILTAGGITIGWLLNQLSSWWNQRSERQRVYRRMLFYMLQLEWIFQRMDVTEFLDVYIHRLKDLKIPGLMVEEQEDNFRHAMSKMLAKLALKRSGQELKSIEEGYKKAVYDLSHIAPFLAFQLEGRTSLVQRLEEAQEWVGDRRNLQAMMEELVAKMHPEAASLLPEVRHELSAVIANQLAFMEDVVEDHQHDELEEDIEIVQELQLKVAWCIGPLTWLRTRRGYRAAGQLPQEDQDAINEFIDDAVEAMAMAMK